jgi:GxxExxY protein
MLTNPQGTNHITRSVIGCAIAVHKALGPGLLESVYAMCLFLELRAGGHQVVLRHAIPLTYRGVKIDASYYADMLVDGCVIVELKAVESLAPIHEVQLNTYLRLANLPVGLLINFNVVVLKDGIRRIVNGEHSEQ